MNINTCDPGIGGNSLGPVVRSVLESFTRAPKKNSVPRGVCSCDNCMLSQSIENKHCLQASNEKHFIFKDIANVST